MPVGAQLYVGGPASVGPAVLLVLAAPVQLYEVEAVNVAGASRWLQIHAVAAPAALAVPIYSFLVLDQQTIAFRLPGVPQDVGRRFPVACSIAWSTTQAVYTAAGAASGPIYAAGREV